MSTRVPSFEEWRYGPKPVAPKDSPLRAHEDSIPSLPVPELERTIHKAVRSCAAIANDQELGELQAKGKDFLVKDGPRLHARLQEKAAKSRNWLAVDWDKLAYLTYRAPVVINVSYFYGFAKLPQSPPSSSSTKDDPAYVAASIAYYAAHYRDKIISGDIEPDQAGGAKQDMAAFQWLFNACRIPAPNEDYSVKIPETDSRGDHVVAIRKNRFYKVPIVGEDGKRASVESLREAFYSIYAMADKEGEGAPLGNLTAWNRDDWATARAHLIASDTNVASLEAVEQAIAVVCLDQDRPSTKDASFSKALWHGGEKSPRFWDKPIQWVIFDNGESGILGEHSVMDGTPTARLNNDMTLDLMANKLPTLSDPSSSPISVASLPFELDDTTLSHIKQATEDHVKNINANVLHYMFYDTYGKEQIKKVKCSPDGWVQMVIQLAYALTNKGQVAATYESASVRRFHLGRTETVRVCSPESKMWCDSMLDNSYNNDQRRGLFRKALAQHGLDMKEASAAQGIDRHLLGMKLCLEGEETPAFLSDPLLAKSSHWLLSTSQVYGRHFPAYGWGCVTDDGYGVPYMIQPESLLFTVTSRKDSPSGELTQNIKRAADTLMALMQDDIPPKAKL